MLLMRVGAWTRDRELSETGLAHLIDEIRHTILRHAELRGRIHQRGAPLVEELPVFRVAGQTDDDEQKGAQHQDNPTKRR